MQSYAMCSGMTLLEQGGWPRWPTVIPSNLTHSVILWCKQTKMYGVCPNTYFIHRRHCKCMETKCFCRKIDYCCNLKSITELLKFLTHFLYHLDILHCQLHIWHRAVSTVFRVCKMSVAPDNNGKATLVKLAEAKQIAGTKTSKTTWTHYRLHMQGW